jgi:hypothetical protein
MPPADNVMLALDELKQGMPALSAAACGYMAEAGAVCLHQNGHPCPVDLCVDGEYDERYELRWPEVTQEALNSHNDPDAAAEFGAYGVAMLLIPRISDYTAIERSRKGTGFDYWLRTKDDVLFQSKARLEVSGIFSGDEKALKARCVVKLKQCAKTNEHLPGYVVVVEFGSPKARVRLRTPQTKDSL